MRPFSIKPAIRIVRATASVAASLASLCSVSLLAGSAVTLSALVASAARAAETDPITVRGEIVIYVPAGVSADRVNQIATDAGCDVLVNLAAPSQYYLLRLKSEADNETEQPVVTRKTRAARIVKAKKTQLVSEAVSAACEKLRSAEAGLLADPNYIRRAARQQGSVTTQVVPSDTYYADSHWDKRLINMPRAWHFQNGVRPVTVANIDTGVDVGHPDLPAPGSANYVDPIRTSLGIVQTGNDPDGVPYAQADDSHGTHTAGTIAAITNNAVGVSGVAGFTGSGVNVRLLTIKASSAFSLGNGEFVFAFSNASIIAAITAAAQRGATAANFSLGGFGSSSVEQRAFTDAIGNGMVIVAATGNDFVNGNRFPSFPANYPGVIAVSAVGGNARLASYSNYGGTTTITAPGGDFDPLTATVEEASQTAVLSTVPRGATEFGYRRRDDGYAYTNGTSMACPHVTGAVALLLAGGANPADVAGILQSTARILPAPNRNDRFGGAPITAQQAYGAGLLDVSAALAPRLRLQDGNVIADRNENGTVTTDRGSTYFRNGAFAISLGGIGNYLRENGVSASATSLSLRIETATSPSTLVQNVPIPTSAIPTLGGTSEPYSVGAFTFTIPNANLGQGRYKATAILTYRNVALTQTQFFEVLDYNQPTGLTLFSVPFQPTTTGGVSQEQQVLGLSTGFSVQRWNPLNPAGTGDSVYAQYVPGDINRDDAYARFTNQFHVADPLHPERAPVALSYAVGNPTSSLAPIGVGYWMNIPDARVVQTVGTPATAPVAIPLFGVEDDGNNFRGIPGWNLIGAPFEFPVNWSSVSIRQNTPTGVRDFTLQEAINAEIINAQLVGWDVPTRSYNFNVFPGGQLLPFRAYWVRALRDCTIIVPPSRSQQVLTSRAAKNGVPMNDGWRVRIAASVAGDRDAQNYFGQTPGATDGEDKFDIAKPPTGPGYADVRFLGTDKRGKKAAYAYDMRPLKAGKKSAEWTMAVGSGKGETDVTLTWDGLGSLPSRAKLSLRDNVTGRVVSMNGRSSYTYKNTEAGATRLFTVSLKEQNTAGPLQIRNVRAVSVGGTRGVTRGVSVRFGLSQEANITGRVTTLGGKVIGNLIGTGRATSQGDVQLRWDGRSMTGSDVPAGSYYVEITAQNDEGESTTVKQPITVLR